MTIRPFVAIMGKNRRGVPRETDKRLRRKGGFMNRKFSRIIAGALALMCMSSVVACGETHQHVFDLKSDSEEYLLSEATCSEKAKYYYHCSCGEVGEKTFTVGNTRNHDYTGKVETAKYLVNAATCQQGAEYAYSCTMCGKSSYNTFFSSNMDDCVFDQEVASSLYLKEEATFTSSAVFYKSCGVCGKAGEATFTSGEPLRVYTDEEKIPYTPVSLTVSLYDAETNTYGFTYHTEAEPLRPVLQIAKGTAFVDYQEIVGTVELASSSTDDDQLLEYYVVKMEVPLEALQTYTYRVYDKYVDIGTQTASLQTKDVASAQFSFVHMGDSQMNSGSGALMGGILDQVIEANDFILHTGDFVENSKYESQWTAMLHANFSRFAQIPVMAISGNHETTYLNGSNEMYEHFHYKMPSQADTKLGFYYSFTYGNAKFIMLNTNRLTATDRLTDDQYQWLVSELRDNTAAWTIVAMHNPMYSAGKYGMDSTRNAIALALRAQLQSIFAQYGVDIVLQGHDHLVSKTKPMDGNGVAAAETFETVDGISYSVAPSGVFYVMSGPAGDQARSPYAQDASVFDYALTGRECSYAEISICGNRLVYTAKYLENGTVKEYRQWGIVKAA